MHMESIQQTILLSTFMAGKLLITNGNKSNKPFNRIEISCALFAALPDFIANTSVGCRLVSYVFFFV